MIPSVSAFEKEATKRGKSTTKSGTNIEPETKTLFWRRRCTRCVRIPVQGGVEITPFGF